MTFATLLQHVEAEALVTLDDIEPSTKLFQRRGSELSHDCKMEVKRKRLGGEGEKDRAIHHHQSG